MSGEHTPGPWVVDPISAWVALPDRDAPICAMLWPTELRSEHETMANARLIAAAPELLQALENMVAVSRSVSGFSPMIREQAERMISKARGAA